jgi:hypothetical protein
LPGGVRVAALVGDGRQTNLISGEEVTKGAEDSTDNLSHVAVSLGATITDEDFNDYSLGIDYQLTSGDVDWSLNGAATFTGTEDGNPYGSSLVGLTFILTVDGGSPQTRTFITSDFTVPSAPTISEVIDLLNNGREAFATVTVVDYTALSGATLTVNGVVLTEGIEWTAATDNDTTASSLASAITTATATTLSTGTATLNAIKVSANDAGDAGNSITLATSDAVNLTISSVTLLNGQDTIDGATTSNDSDMLKVETDAVNNASLLIGSGTSNSVLGFTAGSFVTSPREPLAGKKYFVDYEYAKAPADYAVRFFFNMSDVIAEHGEVSTTDTLSLGAEIVFEQGASAIALVQIDPAGGPVVTQFKNAIDKLATVDGINIVVPLSTDTSLFSYLKSHVNTTSSLTERKERTGIVGMSGSPSISTVMTQAQALNSKRMVLVSPTSATRFVGNGVTPSTLDGSFLAAAIAGIRTSRAFDVADPLTRKEIVGFESIPDTLLRAEKNQLSGAGVCVVENVSSIPRVRFGTTTAPASVDTREYSVVEIIDFVASNMRKLLEAIFIGQKILLDTPSQVRSTVSAVLQDLINREVIVGFDQVAASINGIDPTQVDVSFRISPVFPLNWILITFSLSV